MKNILLAGSLALLLLGCDSDSAGGGASGNQGGGGGGSTGEGGGPGGCAPVADATVTDVSGRWALRTIGAQRSQPQGLDEFQTRIISVMLVEQQQGGEGITASASYCDHTTEDDGAIVSAIIPDTYREMLKPMMRTGTFAQGEGGLRYRLDRLYEVVGATLQDTAEEALPTEPDDPRVIDEDDDGRPGVTILLSGLVDGEVHVVERKRTELDGVAVSKDRIEGTLDFASEQSVVGADPASLEASIATTRTYPDPETCSSTFVLVRVPDDADCAFIKGQADTLFD
jgi:hypothetical protein